MSGSPPSRGARRIGALVFFQMLPATLLAPAVRPFFATFHGSDVSAMHAFMSVNMIGAALGAVVVSRVARRRASAWVAGLAALDAVLLATMLLPLRVPTLLAVRGLEGAAHVGACSLLLASAAERRQSHGERYAIALAGGALMLAIAFGSLLGAAAVSLDVRAPFLGASIILSLVAAFSWREELEVGERAVSAPASLSGDHTPALRLAVGAAFVGRFTVGCVVVSFALFAHHVHGRSDGEIGALFAALTFPFAFLTYPAGHLAERFSRAALLAVGAVILSISLMLLRSAPTAALSVVMMGAGLGCASLFAPALCYAAAGATAAGRRRGMAYVNAAGCLGMLLGPAASGVLSAVLRDPADPGRGPRAAFALAATAVVCWLATSLPSLTRAAREELQRAAVERGAR